jgi:hypothetical protein
MSVFEIYLGDKLKLSRVFFLVLLIQFYIHISVKGSSKLRLGMMTFINTDHSIF